MGEIEKQNGPCAVERHIKEEKSMERSGKMLEASLPPGSTAPVATERHRVGWAASWGRVRVHSCRCGRTVPDGLYHHLGPW